jgi:hypothetical protein
MRWSVCSRLDGQGLRSLARYVLRRAKPLFGGSTPFAPSIAKSMDAKHSFGALN